MAFTTPEDEKKIKAYLSGCLTQYSDADASILSDYIVALLQKNGDLPSLKKECNKELSAFMNTKTETFVEELFVFLRRLVSGNDTKMSKIIQPRRRVEIQRSNDDTNIVIAMNLNNKNNDSKNNTESNVESLISNPAKDFDIPSNELKNNKKSDKTSSDNDSDINSDRNNIGSSRERRRHRQRRYHSRKRRHYNNNSNNNGSNINTSNGIENVNVEVLGKLLTMISQASQPSLQVTPNPSTIYPKLIPTNNNVKANLLNKRLDELNNFSLPYKKHSKNIPNIRRNRKRTYTNMNNTNNNSNNSINNNNDNNSSPNNINNNAPGNVIKKRRKETAENEKRQLFISNIPSELNDVMKLTSYFGQFGEIENIQVHRNMGKAYIQYSKHDDAVVALENPEAILQNNDIKVNWAHYNRPDFDKKARYKFGENKEQYISNDDNINDDSGTGINTSNNNSVSKYSHNYNRKYRGGYAGSTYNKSRKYLNYKTNPKQLTWISDEYKNKLINKNKNNSNDKNGDINNDKNSKNNSNDDGMIVDNVNLKLLNEKIPKDKLGTIKLLEKKYDSLDKMMTELRESKNNYTENEFNELENGLNKTMDTVANALNKALELQELRIKLLKNKDLYKEAIKKKLGNKYINENKNNENNKNNSGKYLPKWKRNKLNNNNKSKKTKNISFDYRTGTILISNLPVGTIETELKAHFLKYGKINSIDMLTHNCAKIEFEKRLDGHNAMMKGKLFNKSGNTYNIDIQFTDKDEAIKSFDIIDVPLGTKQDAIIINDDDVSSVNDTNNNKTVNGVKVITIDDDDDSDEEDEYEQNETNTN